MAETKPKREWVPLDRLLRVPGLQMRAALPDGLTNPTVVERYHEAMADGDEFPPLEVVSDGKTYWLFDGFQRAAALERAGKGSAECLVFAGQYQDALLRAISANAKHGLTRTTNDCRRALITLLNAPELLQKTLAHVKDHGGVHRTLAAACCVSKSLVNKVLEECNLRVVGGKLLKKRSLAAPHPCDATEPDIPIQPKTSSDQPLTSQPDRETVCASAGSHPSQESSFVSELERARAAIAAVWCACRKLLDGPLAVQLLRSAAHHNMPFSREGAPAIPLKSKPPQEVLSAIACWAPVGTIEAVLSDLAALASGGLDLDE